MRRPDAKPTRSFDGTGAALFILSAAGFLTPGPVNALLPCLGYAVVFIVAALNKDAARRFDDRVFWAPAALFAAAVAALVWAATPFALGGVHPLWTPVGGGSAVLDDQAALIGLLQLAGLVFAFLAAASIGARPDTVRNTLVVMLGCGSLLNLIGLIDEAFGFQNWRAALPLMDPGVKGAVAGVVLLMAAETLLRTGKTARGAKAFAAVHDRIRSRPLSVGAGLLALLTLVFAAPPAALVGAVACVAFMAGWTVVTGGRETGASIRVHRWLVPAMAALTFVAAALIASRFPASSSRSLSASAHWSAFWASPWTGYGLGSVPEVGAMLMTRLNAAALVAAPWPPSSMLIWLEQGGALAFAPLMTLAVWISGSTLLGALRTRRLDGVMRMSVCASLFLVILALSNAATATFPVTALWLILMGLGFGLATSSR